MNLKFIHLLGAIALVTTAGMLAGGGASNAADDPGTGRSDLIPPQTLPQGFESTRELQRDAQRAQRAPLYSA